jgi:hypothetical protein
MFFPNLPLLVSIDTLITVYGESLFSLRPRQRQYEFIDVTKKFKE